MSGKKVIRVRGWINKAILPLIKFDERGYVSPIPIRVEPLSSLDVKVELTIEKLLTKEKGK